MTKYTGKVYQEVTIEKGAIVAFTNRYVDDIQVPAVPVEILDIIPAGDVDVSGRKAYVDVYLQRTDDYTDLVEDLAGYWVEYAYVGSDVNETLPMRQFIHLVGIEPHTFRQG